MQLVWPIYDFAEPSNIRRTLYMCVNIYLGILKVLVGLNLSTAHYNFRQKHVLFKALYISNTAEVLICNLIFFLVSFFSLL